MRPFLLSAAAVVLAAAAGRADEPAHQVFEVADLVIPVPDFAAADIGPPMPGRPRAPSPAERFRRPSAAEQADKLIRQVTTVVCPGTWAPRGAGTVEYVEPGHTLVVKNAPDVVAEVGAYLDALKRLNDTSVVTEVRLLSLPAGFAAGAGLKPGEVLPEADVRRALETARGNAHCHLMQAPKLTTFDGQVATIAVGEQRLFVTGIEAVPVKDQVVCVPQNKAAALGDAITLCGRLTADGKAVNLRVHAARTRLADPKVELVPVVTKLTPVFEGGSQGVPVMFTQHLQAPRLKTDSAEQSARVPTGGTLVVGGWAEPGGRTEYGPPVLSRIPYVGRLFKTQGIGPDREVIVLATVRVIASEEPVGVVPLPREVGAGPLGR
ncbi:MAG: type II and III secretion system protein [Gemmataceae bacterium]|nr:type II and III secretion system protein [Gemmataceae bacterium]